MTTSLVGPNGKTVVETVDAFRAVVGAAGDIGTKAIVDEVRDIVIDEGHRFHIRARKTRKAIPLGAKTAKSTAGRAVIEGAPWGFWSIITSGSKAHRIERKAIGDGKNRRALLRTPYGPRPYVLHPGHGSIGRPWAQAMTRVEAMPDAVFATPVAKILDKAWNG